MKLLLVGPLPIDNESLGGAKIAFLNMVNYFKGRADFDICVINTSRRISSSSKFVKLSKNIFSSVYMIIEYLRLMKGKDIIVINMSSGGVRNLSWLLALIGKNKNTKVVLRVFGGNLDEKISKFFFRYLFNKITIPNTDLLVLETKKLCNLYQNDCKIFWLPNTRDILYSSIPRKNVRHIIFLSHVRKDKGIPEILEISSELPDDIRISIYGSLGFDIALSDFNGYRNITYKGVVEASAIPRILERADLLILPTYYDGEGYPGTIIEAFQSGMTVISTKWKSIPEVVENGKNGMLIEPNNSDQLLGSILKLYNNDEEYRRLCANAVLSGEKYQTNYVYEKFAQKILRF